MNERNDQPLFPLPYKVFDGDSHIVEPPELWQQRVPARLKERAPKLLKRPDGTDAWSFDNGKRIRPMGISAVAGFTFIQYQKMALSYDEILQGGFNPHVRVKQMSADGIWAQVLYPTITLPGARAYGDDKELQLACVAAYNDWLIEDFCGPYPDRLRGIAVMPTAGIEEALGELERSVKKGHKGAVISRYPNGSLEPDGPVDDKFWAMAQEMGIPISIHAGSFTRGPELALPGILIIGQVSANKDGIQAIPVLHDLIFSGVCERFPKIKFLLAESNIGWIPALLEQTDDCYMRYRFFTSAWEKLSLLPSEYFHRNFYATFLQDAIGIELRHHLNMDHIMWSTDFPHSACDWPNTRWTMERMFKGVPGADVKKMTHDNVAALYHIPG